MNALANISDIIIPLVVFFVVGYGLVSGVKVYETFLKGAKEGLKIVVDIMPTLIGLMIAVGILRSSGFFELLGVALQPLTQLLRLPGELIPVLIVKLFSSSAATGLVLDIFRNYGPDSFVGTVTSILMSCTDIVVIYRRNKESPHNKGFGVCPCFFPSKAKRRKPLCYRVRYPINAPYRQYEEMRSGYMGAYREGME